jgi:hypothetical protein
MILFFKLIIQYFFKFNTKIKNFIFPILIDDLFGTLVEVINLVNFAQFLFKSHSY